MRYAVVVLSIVLLAGITLPAGAFGRSTQEFELGQTYELIMAIGWNGVPLADLAQSEGSQPAIPIQPETTVHFAFVPQNIRKFRGADAYVNGESDRLRPFYKAASNRWDATFRTSEVLRAIFVTKATFTVRIYGRFDRETINLFPLPISWTNHRRGVTDATFTMHVEETNFSSPEELLASLPGCWSMRGNAFGPQQFGRREQASSETTIPEGICFFTANGQPVKKMMANRQEGEIMFIAKLPQNASRCLMEVWRDGSWVGKDDVELANPGRAILSLGGLRAGTYQIKVSAAGQDAVLPIEVSK